MATFPTLSAIPVFPLEEEEENSTISSPFEAGYEQTRPRFTRRRKTWRVKYSYMTGSDKSTLSTFVNTVSGGADAFTWTNPTDSSSYNVRFVELPRYSCVLKTETASYYDVEFTIREV